MQEIDEAMEGVVGAMDWMGVWARESRCSTQCCAMHAATQCSVPSSCRNTVTCNEHCLHKNFDDMKHLAVPCCRSRTRVQSLSGPSCVQSRACSQSPAVKNGGQEHSYMLAYV